MSWVDFQHEAMATSFALHISGHPADYAAQAAAAAWRELDRLENELSRFIESSDISRLNRLAEGESTVVGDDTFECLLLAAQVALDTAGAFDIAYASGREPGTASSPPFTLDPSAHTVTAQVARLRIDLGAIGKGYALDRMAALLGDWEIDSACLQGGGSTALALDRPTGRLGWPVGLGEEPETRLLELTRAALSGSGIAVKGAHLIDPRAARPAARTSRVWALAPSAALSDALSTAFFVWTDDEIASYCATRPELGAAVMADGRLVSFGALVA